MALPDASGIVVAVAWSSAVTTVLAVAIRSVLKARMVRHIGADDIFIWIAVVCHIGFCVTMYLQAEYGLGKDISMVTSQMAAKGLKASYASYLLYMPAIATAKLSVVSVLRKCALNKRDRLLLYVFEWVLVIWSLASEGVKTFQCSDMAPFLHFNLPCIDPDAWCTFFMLFNCVTELWLIVIPLLNIVRLPTTWDKKLLAITLFSARILIVPASIMVIVSWDRGGATANSTFDVYPFSIWVAVTSTHEIVSACVLYVRPMFEVLELGFTAVPLERKVQRGNPNIGLYSKGSWPFTHVSTLDEILTNRGATYHVDIQATPYSEDILPKGGSTQIHVSEKVCVQSSHSTASRKWGRSDSIMTESQASDVVPISDEDLSPMPRI